MSSSTEREDESIFRFSILHSMAFLQTISVFLSAWLSLNKLTLYQKCHLVASVTFIPWFVLLSLPVSSKEPSPSLTSISSHVHLSLTLVSNSKMYQRQERLQCHCPFYWSVSTRCPSSSPCPFNRVLSSDFRNSAFHVMCLQYRLLPVMLVYLFVHK